MTIRTATLSDYNDYYRLFYEVQEVHCHLYPETFRKPSRSSMSRKVFGKYLSDRKNHILMAYDKAVPVGYIYVTVKPEKASPLHTRPRVVYINQICVTRKYRRKNIAKMLIDRIADLARKKKIGLIQLDVWTLNESARIFFRRLGFKEFNVKMDLKI